MDARAQLPSVDRLLSHESLHQALQRWQRATVLAVLREELEAARRDVGRGLPAPATQVLVSRCAARLGRLDRSRPRRTINAAGVVLHTNLGRAPLGREAVQAIVRVAQGYSDLEFDLDSGRRGHRMSHVDDMLRRLFPGREAIVVNNNAAAVMLALNTMALGKEVVISRGELIEIGGSFRVPEILSRSGARLVEVGTTNRTHLRDYQAAIGPETGMIMKVWPSNYRIVGFTREVGVKPLAQLARDAGVPLVTDQGCGRLFRDAPGPRSEPSVEELLEEGAELVCFSGDKMLGGPQAGLMVGDPEIVQTCWKNPMARALRPDKMTLAGLSATCRAWMQQGVERRVPAARMLDATAAELRKAARSLARAFRRRRPHLELEVVEGVSRVGGGSAPEEDLPTWLVAVRPPHAGEEDLLARLRAGDPPVVARAHEGRVLFDPRTLLPGEAREVADALERALVTQD
jgi:L-seryl-tRNA(Ser) seleniumtransferase